MSRPATSMDVDGRSDPGLVTGRRRRPPPAHGPPRPSAPAVHFPRPRCRPASRHGRRQRWRTVAVRPDDPRRRPRRRRGRAPRTCRRSPRRGRRAGRTRLRPAGPMSAGLRRRISLARSRWPSQRWSGVSESQAAEPVEPSISHWSEFFRPALIWETATAPRAPLAKRSRIAATSSVAISRSTVSALDARSRTSRPGRAAGRGTG